MKRKDIYDRLGGIDLQQDLNLPRHLRETTLLMDLPNTKWVKISGSEASTPPRKLRPIDDWDTSGLSSLSSLSSLSAALADFTRFDSSVQSSS